MNDEQLAEWERLCQEATPVPLASQWGNNPPYPHKVWGERGVLARFRNEPDAELYAAARTAMPELIAEVRRLRGLVQSLADRCAAQSEILSRRAEKSQINHDID